MKASSLSFDLILGNLHFKKNIPRKKTADKNFYIKIGKAG